MTELEINPEDIITRLKNSINNGTMGRDYVILPRDKNKELTYKYLIDTNKQKEILLSLTTDDYISSETSINKDFPNDIVHIFYKKVNLIPLIDRGISYKKVPIYIKFTWPDQEEILLIISFHEAEK